VLPRTCRKGRSPDCSYGRLRWRQSGTRTCIARYRRSRLHQRDSCRSCRVVAGYRPNSFGRDLRDARGCRSPFYSPAGRGTRSFPLKGGPTRDIHWLRPFTVDTPACLLPAFTSVTTKCCWTTRSDMLSVQLPQASTPERPPYGTNCSARHLVQFPGGVRQPLGSMRFGRSTLTA